MKKLYRLILVSYLGPFALTFAIAMVFLIMLFLWKYVDELMGKGLPWYVIFELLFYASANIVPMALPLAILLSSIMTFGNLAESSELTAMRSAGLSLLRIMQPLTTFIVIVAIAAFGFANYLWPVANLKFRSLLWDIQQQKPTMNLKEAIFYNDIPGYSIRAMRKNKTGETLEDVLIYDHTNPSAIYKRDIWAEKGKLIQTDDGELLIFHLYNGKIYEEVEPRTLRGGSYPSQKITFTEAKLNFDLSAFKLQRTDVELFRSHYEMLNLKQLAVMEDSLYRNLLDRKANYTDNFDRRFLVYRDTLRMHVKAENPWSHLGPGEKRRSVETALSLARNAQEFIRGSGNEFRDRMQYIQKHQLEWHRKLTLPFACLILFFIGAPMGAIIRKGGIGAPMVASILFFLLYYVISISGEKMARTGVLTPFWGMWISTFILFPIGVFLTYKSNRDSKLFDRDYYLRLFRLKRKIRKPE